MIRFALLPAALPIAAAAVLTLSACSSHDADTASLGSRNDIIVTNGDLSKAEAKAVFDQKIETVKMDAAEAARSQAEMEAKKAMADMGADKVEEVTILKAVDTDANADTDTDTETELGSDSDTVMAAQEKGGEESGVRLAAEEKVIQAAAHEPAEIKSSETEPAETMPAKSSVPATMTDPGMNPNDIPPHAKPGECYAKVLIPAVKETKTQRVQVSDERRVLDKMVPAKYQITTERIKLSDEKKVLARIEPAKYDIVKERVLVKEARKYWKPGTGPITRTDEVTGQIMCLVEEPAEYKTIEKRILVEPEKPVYKTIPAEYKTIEKRVLVEPEKPEYRTEPARFETVTSAVTVQPERWEWRRILCETNMGPDSIARIQRALNAKGARIAVDGKLGNETMNALSAYQHQNGLATRGITYETLEHLGVRLIGA